MSPYLLIPLVAWMTTVFVWGYVYGQRRLDALSISVLLVTSAFSLWLFVGMLLYVPAFEGAATALFRAAACLWVPLGALVMNFAYRLVGRKPDAIFLFFAALAVAGAALGAGTDLVILGHERLAWGVVDVRDPLLHSLLSLVPASAGVHALWLVHRERRRTRESMARRHLGLVLFGGVLAMSLVLLFNAVLPNLLGWQDTKRFGASAMVVFILAIFRAVTRHRFLAIDPEQVAGELFEDAADGVALVDGQGRVLRMNRAGRVLLGVGELEAGAIPLGRLLPGWAPAAFGHRELRIAGAAGERVIDASQVVSGGAGRDRGLVLILRDVTGERRAEEAQRRSREDLEREVESRSAELRRSRQVETLGLLAGGVAHDFHNLLAAILGFAAAARDDLPPGHPLEQDLEEILAAGRRAREMVRQLLAFSRKGRSERRAVIAGPVIEQSLALVGSALPPTVELRRDLRAGDAVIEADGDALHLVVVNLANNANDAMRPGGGVLTVTLERVPLGIAAAEALRPGLGPGSYLRLGVADTGEGMTAEVRARAFEPFFTSRQAERRTGLGLVIVERVVREHRGAVTLRSQPGRGTEVAVFLPLAPPGTAPAAGAPGEVAG
jgi:signal transduction histidine kinase